MKRLLSTLMALIVLLGAALPAMPAYAAPTPEEAMADVRVYYVGESVSYLLYDGEPKGVTPAYYTGKLITGETFEFPAYCINPHKPGPSEAGPYSVDAKDYITNPKIWGIVSNGYPYKSIGELGVHNREQAFYATKMALWTYINGWDVNGWTAANGDQNDTLAALKKIYAAGMAVNEIKIPMFTITPDRPKAELDAQSPTYASQTFTVSADVEIRNYEVFLDGNIPDGTKVTDLYNNPKTVFQPGDKFKVLIPADQISNATGNFEVTVRGQLKTNAVIYGMSYDTALQDFSVTRDPFDFQNATATVLYSPQNTFLEIVKLAAGTGNPLAGAVFKVTDSEGGVIGTFTTDASGRVVVPLTKAGAYQVEEIAPPKGWLLDVNAHKDVIALWEQKTTVTFTNEREPGLELLKIDADTSLPLPGAVLRIAWEGGLRFTDVQTDAAGRAYVLGLAPGAYTVTELSVPEPYSLDPAPQTVVLEAGKSASLTFRNTKKPGVIIWKYDEATGLPLAGAEFSVAKKGGSVVYEGITPATGMIHIESLDPNQWYTVSELASPKGYLKTWESKDVYLEPGKTAEIKFDNRLRPALRVMKVDSQTNEPLAGAKFRVWKTEGGTVSEYVTDESGSFTIYDLDEAVYSVAEYEAPENYLLDPAHKDIRLVWGEVKTLVFTNKAKPALEILKIDAITGEPLPNAEFRVSKAEGDTVSEYITDASGTILIENLDEAIYRAEEFMPPDGYLRYDAGKEIQLEWGKTKTLKFDNIRKPTLIVTKTNGLTFAPIANATFRIEREEADGGLVQIGTYRTNADGRIILPKAEPGWYLITETIPAPGFSLPDNPTTRKYLAPGENAYTNIGVSGTGDISGENIRALSGNDFTVLAEHEVIDYPLNSIVIRKAHAVTGELLSGAVFEVRKVTEDVSGSSGTVIGRYTTDNSGVIVLTGLAPGGYIVEEIQAPPNFLLSENAQQQAWLKWDGTSIVEVTFANIPYGSLLITKVDAQTNNPLANTRFRVTDGNGAAAGNTNGEFVTDSRGEILIPNLKPGAYVVTEIEAPTYYAVDTTPQTVQIGVDGKTYKVSFKDQPAGEIVIRKLDYNTKQPLAGAEFKVTASDGSVVGNSNGVFRTDATGTVKIPNLPKGSYVLEEIKAPAGFVLEQQTQTVAVDYGKTYTLDFYNKKMSGVQIVKIDATSKQPLKGAKFAVYRQSGEIVGHYETGGDGVIILDALAPGWYKAVETKAPDGYLIDDTPQDFEVTSNQFIKLVLENKQLSSLQIRKVSEIDGKPLPGAVFEVRKQSGEFVGEFTTGADGAASIPNAAPGWYVVSETKAPEGYILYTAAKTVEVKPVTPTVVTFTNKPLSGIKIIKLNAATRQPIEGVEFVVARMSGEKVADEWGGYTFKTDKTGQIYIPNLADGYYVVTETKAMDGYILDGEPKTVLVQSGTPTVLEVLNIPMSGLLIVKTDRNTGKPLQGVMFDVTGVDGQRVTGSILDGNQPNTEASSPNRATSPNGDISGSYTTDAQGRILINSLPAGEYHVTERKALDGYELDTEIHAVTVTPGKLATLRFTNTPKAGLRLIKIDSISKRPIYNVEFMVFDANNKAVGTYYTDNNGVIDFSAILTAGRYTIREMRAASGYYRDDVPRTVEFTAGQVTEIRWENTPEMGQVQLTKKSADDNEVSGLPAGTPLAGATFEIYEYKSGNLIDRFVSGSDGRAVSKPLPLGRYLIKEVAAPQWYRVSDKTLDVTVEFATQILKFDFLDYSANTGVYIKKTGPAECMSGDVIRYDIKEARNTGTVPLTDFYWRDTLPTDAVRLTKLVTGTYNQSLKYKILATTNKGDTKVIADNLSTTRNNVIDCSNASLGLRNDEYITGVTLIFGMVKAGFCQVEQPQLYAKVLDTLPNQYRFANKSDCGGKYGGEWVLANSTTVCTVYRKPQQLPRTGY
jgi:TQXA domain-containing protein